MDELEQREESERGRELLAAIDLGLRVQQFLDGPVGQRLIADSEAERKDLADELLTLDTDTDDGRTRSRAIRLRAGILDHWQDLFARYVNAGETAEHEFHETGG